MTRSCIKTDFVLHGFLCQMTGFFHGKKFIQSTILGATYDLHGKKNNIHIFSSWMRRMICMEKNQYPHFLEIFSFSYLYFHNFSGQNSTATPTIKCLLNPQANTLQLKVYLLGKKIVFQQLQIF